MAAVKRALTLGKHVAVDRCHLTEEQRAFFVAVARERGAAAHAVHLNLPRDVILDRVRRRADHVSVNGEKGVGVAKRMMGQKANAPPTRAEGFDRVLACRDDAAVAAAAKTYAALPRAGTANERSVGAKTEDPTEEAREARSGPPPPPTSSPPPQSSSPPPNAFAAMMRAAKTAAATTPRPRPRRPRPNETKRALASRARGHRVEPIGKLGVLSYDDDIVVLRDAYPKAKVHLLVLARDPALRDGPSSLRAAHAVEKMLSARCLADGARVGGGERGWRGGHQNARFVSDFTRNRPCRSCTCTPSRRICAELYEDAGDTGTFATDFFRDASEALRELRAKGELEWDEEEAESRVKMERLRCHACGDGPHPTMPKLFEHLDACVAAPPGEPISEELARRTGGRGDIGAVDV